MRRLICCWSILFVAVVLAGCGQPAACLDAPMQAYQAERAERVEVADAPVEASSAAGGHSWLQLGAVLAAQAEPSEPAPDFATEEAAGFVPWRQRRGPAYPNDFWRSLGRDSKELPLTLWDDTKHAFTDPVFLAGMLAAGVAGIVINGTGVDDTVDSRTDGHRHLSKGLDGLGGFLGSPAQHFWMTGLWYLGSLGLETTGRGSPAVTKSYETSKTMMNALILNGLITQTLKWAVRTESPNGDENGWPSGHTSSSFTVATVMYHAYGPWVGIPLYAFAGFVGYERIDARNHDFSDVISGMIIGTVVGHVVSQNHENKIFGMTLMPYADPERGAFGLALGKTW